MKPEVSRIIKPGTIILPWFEQRGGVLRFARPGTVKTEKGDWMVKLTNKVEREPPLVKGLEEMVSGRDYLQDGTTILLPVLADITTRGALICFLAHPLPFPPCEIPVDDRGEGETHMLINTALRVTQVAASAVFAETFGLWLGHEIPK